MTGANVRYWPKADMSLCAAHVRFQGKADIALIMEATEEGSVVS